MDRDEISNLDQLVDRSLCCALLLKYVVRKERIVSNDVHLECTAKLTYTLTDTAKAHDTKSLASQLAAFEFIFIPLVFYFYIVVCYECSTGDI